MLVETVMGSKAIFESVVVPRGTRKQFDLGLFGRVPVGTEIGLVAVEKIVSQASVRSIKPSLLKVGVAQAVHESFQGGVNGFVRLHRISRASALVQSYEGGFFRFFRNDVDDAQAGPGTVKRSVGPADDFDAINILHL